MRIYRLENSTMPYAWGSPDGLSRALAIPNPTGKPLAELWMGAHSKAPSSILVPGGKRALDEFIRSDPEGSIGLDSLQRFGPRLPFLFKALSAAKPLSIQVHPAKRKAEHGFEKESESGIPVDAYNRNYRDSNHKPELSIALSGFEALCGFRPLDSIIDNMRLLVPDMHKRYFGRLERNPGKIELSVFFYALMTIAPEARLAMIQHSAEAISGLLESGGAPAAEEKAWRWVLELAKAWPGDIGAIAPLIFNYVEFKPGEAVFISPGEPHAYLGGTALEIMANSDNVLRGALTDKHIDI
ncbi:MAG: mannose-6-phosphate isomerase, class I, partial [Spirochaetota bacterium]